MFIVRPARRIRAVEPCILVMNGTEMTDDVLLGGVGFVAFEAYPAALSKGELASFGQSAQIGETRATKTGNDSLGMMSASVCSPDDGLLAFISGGQRAPRARLRKMRSRSSILRDMSAASGGCIGNGLRPGRLAFKLPRVSVLRHMHV